MTAAQYVDIALRLGLTRADAMEMPIAEAVGILQSREKSNAGQGEL